MHLFHKKTYIVKIDESCINCGYCTKVCPPIMKWAHEGKKITVNIAVEKCMRHAMSGCPTASISIHNAEDDK